MRSATRLLSLLVFLLPFTAFADVTGYWAGGYQVSFHCDSGATLSDSGNATAALEQSGDNVTGTLSVTNFAPPNRAQCVQGTTGAYAFAVNGTISGSSFNGTLTTPDGDKSFTGSISGSQMTLNVNGMNATGTISLSQTTAPPPTVDIGGTWSGTVSGIELCNVNQPQQWTGNMTLSLVQSGGVYGGTMTVDIGVQNCAAVSAKNTEAVAGLVADSNFSVTGTDPTIGVFAGGGEVTGDSMIFAFGAGDYTVVAQLTRTGPPAGTAILSFGANPSTIQQGQSSTLSWTTSGATTVTIDNGIGSQPVNGSISVSPSATTTYTLTATGSSGTATASTTVTVNNGSTPPNVVLSQFPSGMIAAPGQTTTDRYTLQNSGGTATDVTLTQNGSFFTQSPSQFRLAAGASRVITITSTPQQPGTYDGASIAGNLSIPIHLLVAAPPNGTVKPQISGTNRVETVATIGQNQGSGSVSFTNSGTATLQGIAISDVPWMIPQSGIITIPPGQTVQINYTIDRTKRADGASPLGGAKCTLSLRFLTNPSFGKWANGEDTTTTTSSVSVSLVDVVKPGVAPGSPSPLGAGEVALFVPGISSKTSALGDFLLSNRSGASIGDLRLFFGGSGAPTQVSSIGSLAANAGVSFPGIVKNVFGAAAQTGSVQLRSSKASSISVSTVQVNTTSASSSYATALPVLRSDRGIGAGGALYFGGVTGASPLATNLELQEMSGNAATVATDFFDANGNSAGSRTDSLPAFGFSELTNVVPSGAATMRVRNTSSGGAILGAYAMVVDATTNDAFVVTDLGTSSDITLFVPSFPTASGAWSRIVTITNKTAAPVTATVTPFIGASHHRAAPHALVAAGNASSATTFNVPAFGTVAYTPSGIGYVRVDGPAGALQVSSKMSQQTSGGNFFGAGLPSLTSLFALASGDAKRFAGVEDAAATTVASATPSTYRTNMMLIETSGQSTTARVTMTFTFLASSVASATTTASKDFEVPANGSVLITDLARTILGSQRDSLGDLHNIQVDVTVVGGSGKVVPVVEAIDNATSDVAVRKD